MGWDALCLLLAFITLLIIVMLHMISISFGLPSLTMWAKAEYAQVAVTFLIVLFAIGMRDAGNDIMGQITAKVAAASGNVVLANAAHSYVDDPVKIGKEYIINGPIRCAKNIYKITFLVNVWNEFWSGVSASVGNVEGVSGAYLIGGYVSLAHYLAQNISYLALFQYIQYNMLQYSQYTMLQIFLPVGLALRAFPITRGAGGLVIGFALGFAFVFPITYVLIVAMMPPTEYACTSVVVQAQNSPYYTPNNPCFNNVGNQVAVAYRSTSDTSKDGIFQAAMHAVEQLYLEAMFYPMVTLIIVFSFIRQTSSLFGADLAEIGRGLIKII